MYTFCCDSHKGHHCPLLRHPSQYLPYLHNSHAEQYTAPHCKELVKKENQDYNSGCVAGIDWHDWYLGNGCLKWFSCGSSSRRFKHLYLWQIHLPDRGQPSILNRNAKQLCPVSARERRRIAAKLSRRSGALLNLYATSRGRRARISHIMLR